MTPSGSVPYSPICTWATFALGSQTIHFSLLSSWLSNLPDATRRTQWCITSLKENQMIHFSFYYSGAFQTDKNPLHFYLQSLYVIPITAHNNFDPLEANFHPGNKTINLKRNRCAKCTQWVTMGLEIPHIRMWEQSKTWPWQGEQQSQMWVATEVFQGCDPAQVAALPWRGSAALVPPCHQSWSPNGPSMGHFFPFFREAFELEGNAPGWICLQRTVPWPSFTLEHHMSWCQQKKLSGSKDCAPSF